MKIQAAAEYPEDIETMFYRNLWVGTMAQAIKDLTDDDAVIRGSAKYWLTRKEAFEYPHGVRRPIEHDIGSFVGICELFCWDPEKTRKRILENRITFDEM